jgi:hypothetical protein
MELERGKVRFSEKTTHSPLSAAQDARFVHFGNHHEGAIYPESYFPYAFRNFRVPEALRTGQPLWSHLWYGGCNGGLKFVTIGGSNTSGRKCASGRKSLAKGLRVHHILWLI